MRRTVFTRSSPAALRSGPLLRSPAGSPNGLAGAPPAGSLNGPLIS